MDSQKDFNENNDARNVEEEKKKIKENSDNSKYNDEINVQLERKDINIFIIFKQKKINYKIINIENKK